MTIPGCAESKTKLGNIDAGCETSMENNKNIKKCPGKVTKNQETSMEKKQKKKQETSREITKNQETSRNNKKKSKNIQGK